MNDQARNFSDDDFIPPTPHVEPVEHAPDGAVQFFPFLHQSDDFALGFEAGEVWHAMQDGAPLIEGNFAERNKGELMRLAEKGEYRCAGWLPGDGGLSFGRFEKA